jgi:hypothetical protein
VSLKKILYIDIPCFDGVSHLRLIGTWKVSAKGDDINAKRGQAADQVATYKAASAKYTDRLDVIMTPQRELGLD